DGRAESLIAHRQGCGRLTRDNPQRQDQLVVVGNFLFLHQQIEQLRRLVAFADVVARDTTDRGMTMLTDDLLIVHSQNRNLLGDLNADLFTGIDSLASSSVGGGEQSARQ